MKSVFDVFQDYRHIRNIESYYTDFIFNQFIKLFKIIFNVDIPNESSYFILEGSKTNNENTDVMVNYRFKYGNLSIITRADILDIRIFIRDNSFLKAPFNSKCCEIKTDHNLNLINANIVFNFYIRGSNSPDYCVLGFKRVIDDLKVFNLIELLYMKAKNEISINSDDGHISKKYFEIDYNFEISLCNFIQFYSNNSVEFKVLFPDFIEGVISIEPEKIFNFLNKFSYQYEMDIDNFRSRLLLLEMVKI